MNKTRALLIGSLVWVALYAVTTYSVYWLLRNDLSVFYSVIPSSLEYLVPGFVVAYLAKEKTYVLAVLIGVGGSIAWLLHTGFYTDPGRLGQFAALRILGNILLALVGAYIAVRVNRARLVRA
jgi:hypothetical protein